MVTPVWFGRDGDLYGHYGARETPLANLQPRSRDGGTALFQPEAGGDKTNPFPSKEKNRGTTECRHRPSFEPIGGGSRERGRRESRRDWAQRSISRICASLRWSPATEVSSWRRRSGCSALSSILSASAFSSTRDTRLVPGMGAMSSPWASSEANEIWAEVHPTSSAMDWTSSALVRLRWKFPPVKRGFVLRKSESGSTGPCSPRRAVLRDPSRAVRILAGSQGSVVPVGAERVMTERGQRPHFRAQAVLEAQVWSVNPPRYARIPARTSVTVAPDTVHSRHLFRDRPELLRARCIGVVGAVTSISSSRTSGRLGLTSGSAGLRGRAGRLGSRAPCTCPSRGLPSRRRCCPR